MRLLVLFDLPMDTSQDARVYRVFRKYLIAQGFFMLQKSVYTKMVLNESAAKNTIEDLRKNKPSNNGSVFILTVTEKQFASMDIVLGSFQTDVVNTMDKVVII